MPIMWLTVNPKETIINWCTLYLVWRNWIHKLFFY